MPLSSEQYVIPKGSTVLVTGVNGFIASNIADQFLRFGYKVRGTTRNPEKNAWVSKLFDDKYGPNNFEFAFVPDMATPGAFDEAVKGVSAVIHTATVFTLDPNPHNVIPDTLAGTVNAMKAAAKDPSVKRFVLTSSSSAALTPKPNTPLKVTVDTWNDEVVELAYRDPPYEADRSMAVYGASKTLAEKEAWKFMEENKPHFTFNAVLPNFNTGASLDSVNQGHPTTSSIVAALFKGDANFLGGITAQHFVDVQDDAILHVAAAIHPDVESERVFAFAQPINGDGVLAILRELYPNRDFPPNFRDEKDISEIVPRERSETLLRDLGQDGWTSLKESIRKNTEDLV